MIKFRAEVNKIKRKNFQIVGITLILIAVLFPYAIPRTLQVATITAASGSATDIQIAVDQIYAQGGGDVHIPVGTFNFVEVGEPWMTVNIPVGVNLFGAPTERDANSQVIEWKTVLVMPWEVPTGATWFAVHGDGSESFRFSDIKMVGWRFFDNNSTTTYQGVWINQIQNFRVDHCNFQDIAGNAIIAGVPARSYNRDVANGVIDHCRLVNTLGDPGFPVYENLNVGYGIMMRRWASDVWDPLSEVLGHHTPYTIFIEDNYFSKWRHSTSSNDGIHQVFRHNIVEGGYGIGEADAHGSYATADYPYAVGTRAIEVYKNTFRNPDTTWYSMPWAINHRGGSGIFFNNKLEGYYALCDLNNDYGNIAYVPHCHINDTYIWNNDLGGAILIKYNYDNVENVNFFLRAPNLVEDGFEYTPYPYPHPLVTGGEPPATGGTGTLSVEASYNNQSITANVEVSTFNGQTPYSQELPVGTYTVVVRSDYGSNTQIIEILSGQITSINIKWSSTSDDPVVDIETKFELLTPSLLMQITLVSIGALMIWNGRKKQR